MECEDRLPKATEVRMEVEVAPPSAVVIFGASGDLTKRKLIPALYNLYKYKILPDQFFVLGIARHQKSDEAFRLELKAGLADLGFPVEPESWENFALRLHYLPGDGGDPTTYADLQATLLKLSKEHGEPTSVVFYLAVAPSLYEEITQRLGAAGLVDEEPGRGRRVVFEKPFGRDLQSARTLNQDLRLTLKEEQPRTQEWKRSKGSGTKDRAGTLAVIGDSPVVSGGRGSKVIGFGVRNYAKDNSIYVWSALEETEAKAFKIKLTTDFLKPEAFAPQPEITPRDPGSRKPQGADIPMPSIPSRG